MSFNPVQFNRRRRRGKFRHSSGVACCRLGQQTGKLEMLCVRKRYTYAFVKFAQGDYDPYNCEALFNQMTVQEKLDIQSMRFDIIWFKIFNELPGEVDAGHPVLPVHANEVLDLDRLNRISNGESEITEINIRTYHERRRKFQANWNNPRARARLRKMIARSSSAHLRWEIPKGGGIEGETTIACAIREFEQETLLYSNDNNREYVILPVDPITASHEDNGITWNQTYYIAISQTTATPCVNMTTLQSQEIDDVRWMTHDDIVRFGNDERLNYVAATIFDVVSSCCRGGV